MESCIAKQGLFHKEIDIKVFYMVWEGRFLLKVMFILGNFIKEKNKEKEFFSIILNFLNTKESFEMINHMEMEFKLSLMEDSL